MSKKGRNPEKIQTRWGLPKHVHRKIAAYQKLNGLESLEAAGVLLLEKVTQNIKIEL